MAKAVRMGLALRAYLAVSRGFGLLGPGVLRQRLAKGREDPARWREKLGETVAVRPAGRLVWLHAVGIGEVMALRGLIEALSADDSLSFLITSSARSSAQVIAGNLPARTQHQYLPLDAPCYLARFLNHWHPDLSVWAEQDIWPGAVVATHRRGIPLALVNARMAEASFRKRSRVSGLYGDLYARFALITAQDAQTARHLEALGASGVQVSGSLKPAAPVLSADSTVFMQMKEALRGRRVWLAASTHPEDEAVALTTQKALWWEDPSWLLILAPRDPRRSVDPGLPFAQRSARALPGAGQAVFLADSFGEMGLWYRLAMAALVGGSFGPVQGHNPWEPAALGCPVLHGPNVANFAADYATLDALDAARPVTAESLKAALLAPDIGQMGQRGLDAVAAARESLRPLAAQLRGLMNG